MNPQHEGQAFSSTPSGDEVPLQYQQSPDSPSRTVAAKDSAKNATFQQSLTATAAEVASSDAVAKNDGGAMQLDTSTGELQQKASNAGLEEEVHARHRLTTEVGGTNNDDQI